MRTSIFFSFATCFTAAALVVGCGSEISSSSTTGTSSGGSGGVGGVGGVGGTTSTAQTGGSGGTGAQGGTGGTGGAGGNTVCGGKMGKPCQADEFCDFEGTVPCGQADGTGICTQRPDFCPKDCPGVCGCDGQTYCNECLAHAAGMDVNSAIQCNAAVDCQQVVADLAAQAGGVHTCTTLVRLDYQTLTVKSYHLECAPYAATSESAARATAEADTGYGQGNQLISGANPEDEYVFWEPAGDFGGAGVVNARNGKSVFGGSVVWDGAGQITYPDSFLPAALLGPGCGSLAPKTTARGFDLGSGLALPQGDVDAAVDVVWSTALPDGLWQNSYVFDAMVLLYSPTVGAMDPATAEWLVLVNSGWLD